MTYASLLNRLSDMRLLALPVQKGERGGCMSSFDRASRYDAQTDLYIDWAANDDGSGAIRALPDGGIVAFELAGPGVIWRVWSALPKQGHMRVFVNGETEPAFDMPFIDWFDKQPGDIPPLNLPELSPRLSRGRNCFIPIPFTNGCRIELIKDWGAYCHFTYTRFLDGTVLPDCRERLSNEGMIALAQADRILYERGEAPLKDRGVEKTLAPGQAETLFQKDGSGGVTSVSFFPHGLTDTGKTLRLVLLRLYWDGEETPSVEVPLGDFFGGAPGYAHQRTLPVSMERDRYTCRFFMPFDQGMRLEAVNLTHQAQRVALALEIDDTVCNACSLLRFHAKWHRGFMGALQKERFAPGGDRWPDWPMLLLNNVSGRFVGVHLHILNRWAKPPQKADAWWYGKWDQKTIDWWWGEGDEKFFVDGETFPSTFGTGSEDYIGYAWAAEPPFARFDSAFAAMNAMPIDGNGHTSVSRFHIADCVPFENRFEAFIEKYKPDIWEGQNECLYAATPFWYQEAGTRDMYPPVDAAALSKGLDSDMNV